MGHRGKAKPMPSATERPVSGITTYTNEKSERSHDQRKKRLLLPAEYVGEWAIRFGS